MTLRVKHTNVFTLKGEIYGSKMETEKPCFKHNKRS